MNGLYELAETDNDVDEILRDTTLNHQQATEELNVLFSEFPSIYRGRTTTRTSVRRARNRMNVASPHPNSGQNASRYHAPASETLTSSRDLYAEPDPVTYNPWPKGKPATAVFLGDWQTGCENQALIDASIELIKDLQPDIIGHTGDETDNTVLGRWVKGTGAEYAGTLQDQIDRAEKNLRGISEVAPDARKHLADSNHNDRLEKAVAERLPGLDSLRCLKMDRLLRLSENGWSFHREQYEVLPDLLLFHGHAEGFNSSTPLKRIEDFLLRKGKSFIFGHTHRFGLHTTSQGYEFDMRTLFAANPGHMMELHHADYVRHRSPNWSSGLIIVHYDGKDLYPETILAKNNRLFYQGKRY